MLYATAEDLIAEMPLCQLADYVAEGEDHDQMVLHGDTPSKPKAHIERALSDASELINGYIKVRYPKLDKVPQILRKACVRIAISHLVDRKFTGVSEISGWSSANRVEQIKLLEQISKGVVTLGIEGASEKSEVKIRVSNKKTRLGDIFD